MSNKIKVKSIELVRAEGPNEECNKKHIFSSFSEANKQLKKWSLSAPKTGGCDKCDFNVTFEDGQQYNAVYDLKHFSCVQDEGPEINLQVRIASYCRYIAGYERPSWMSDSEWEQAKASNKPFENDFKDFLEKYDI